MLLAQDAGGSDLPPQLRAGGFTRPLLIELLLPRVDSPPRVPQVFEPANIQTFASQLAPENSCDSNRGNSFNTQLTGEQITSGDNFRVTDNQGVHNYGR